MRLYVRLLWASIRSRMQYRVDFIATTIMYGLMMAVDFLTVAVILHRYGTVGGWNLYEVALLAGVTATANGLHRTFAGELNGFERYLVSGEFDSLLIRPWPTLASLLARNFDLGRAGAVLQGFLLIGIGLNAVLAQGAPPWLAVYLCLLPVAGFGIIVAINLAVAAAGFWLTRIDELTIFALNAPQAAASYPLNIYPGWLRGLFTSLLPVAAFGYVPLNYALGKGGSPLALAAPFLAAAGSLLVGLRLWRIGERQYQSTGS